MRIWLHLARVAEGSYIYSTSLNEKYRETGKPQQQRASLNPHVADLVQFSPDCHDLYLLLDVGLPSFGDGISEKSLLTPNVDDAVIDKQAIIPRPNGILQQRCF